ncbi:MAG: phosphotransferase [Muribaculaceae bacterium]|nr:phosphotransferase [Muribaculaceae bacterium]
MAKINRMALDQGIELLLNLFYKKFHSRAEIQALTGGGSARKYYRLTDGLVSAVGVISNEISENEAFISLSKALKHSGINVPEIFEVSDDAECYLLQDLGDEMLMDALKGADKMNLAKKALSILTRINTLPEDIWIDKVIYPPFSQRLVYWDLNYFKYDFLKPYDVEFDESLLEDDFQRLSSQLTSGQLLEGLMYRDFQSRNIMLKDGEMWFIDYQGARRGPVVYDAVSFVWQAKAPFSFDEREKLIDFYAASLSQVTGLEESEIRHQCEKLEVLRCLQVLGAYGFRGLIQKKTHFLESIPFAVRNLMYLREKGRLDDFPEIKKITGILWEKENRGKQEDQDFLEVKVFSFSYKRGYPEDNSGNGGGFIFDCRAIHNPGRYDKYKTLTGRDTSVIEFLEKTDEAQEFVEMAVKMVVPSIERYIKRGFTSLQVGFGCTGGQHRSVYCAEKFAKEIASLFPNIKISITHREQNIRFSYLPE